MKPIRPPMLRPGDRVRVVSPAGPVEPASVARGVEILTGWGLAVEVAPHAFDRAGYLAGPDAVRLADLNAALRDPGVRGVFAARGGYGTQRIVDGIDVDAVRRDPRVVVGFSDVTSLLATLWRRAGLVTFHGPTVERTGADVAGALRAAVMTAAPLTVCRDPADPTASIRVAGTARGLLLGGNLTMVAADAPDLTGAIFFFEEAGEAPYRIDRMLTQLRRAGALARISGVAIGGVTGADATAVLGDRLGDLGVPVLGGLPLGHGPGQRTVPLGVPATLDADAGTLTVTAGVAP